MGHPYKYHEVVPYQSNMWVIKEKVEQLEGIPPVQQRLVYQGKQIKENISVEEAKLTAGAKLHLVVALRGGGELISTIFEYE